MGVDRYGEPGERCPFKGCTCVGPAACPPGWPCFIDKTGDVIVLVEYDDADRSQLLELYETIRSQGRSLGRPPRDPENLADWLDSILDSGTNYVAYHESMVVGHSTYSPGATRTPELLTFVHPAYWDRGIGTELSRHCIQTATRKNDALLINVARSNGRATHVGKKLGFCTAPMEEYSTRMRLTFDTDPYHSDA